VWLHEKKPLEIQQKTGRKRFAKAFIWRKERRSPFFKRFSPGWVISLQKH